MKKVCFFLEKIDASGGIPRVVSIITNGLYSRGYSVDIVSLTNDNDNNERYCLNENISISYIFKNRNLSYKRDFWKIAKAIDNHFVQKKYESIIIAGMDFIPFFNRANNIFKDSQLIAWEHSNYTIGSKFGFRSWGRRIASKKFNKIIVLTDRDVRLYKKGIKKLNCEIRRIYNPIENKDKNHEYNADSKTILSCGALIEQKGFDYAVEVAEIVFKENKDWQWLIYGEGSERNKLERLIAEKGLTKQLLLKGYTNDIGKAYRDAAFFVLPSRFEGFCMVNLEAMQMKLPVVAFDFNCGPDEIIMDGINGFVIEDFSVSEMAQKILLLINDANRRKDMSEKCYKSLRPFQLDGILDEWERVIGD